MKEYPNQPEKAAELKAENCITGCEASSASAYDEFQTQFTDLIRVAGEAKDPLMVRLCLLGMTSITEEYFRAVLSGITRICPKSYVKAAKESISVAASLYYPKDGMGYALIEHLSLSDADAIKKQTIRLCDLQIPDSSSLSEALKEFDKVCHLRHAAIHSNGRLSALNAVNIGIAGDATFKIALTLTSFQDIAEICLNTVRAYNRFIWEKTLDRWVKAKIIVGDAGVDMELIRRIVELLCENSAQVLSDDGDLGELYKSSVLSRLRSS